MYPGMQTNRISDFPYTEWSNTNAFDFDMFNIYHPLG